MKQSNTLKESLGSFLHNLWDLMILNWLWLLCSLLLITVGPASCALYYVTLKLVRGEAVYPVKDFFRTFRENLKPGLLLGLLAAALLAVAAGDAFFALQQTGMLQTVYLVIAVMVGALFLTLTCFTFPLQAMFENPLKTQLKNAFLLAFTAPGKTLLLWVIALIPVAAALLLPPVALQMLGFLYVILGASGPVFLSSRILRDLFDRVNGAPVIQTEE